MQELGEAEYKSQGVVMNLYSLFFILSTPYITGLISVEQLSHSQWSMITLTQKNGEILLSGWCRGHDVNAQHRDTESLIISFCSICFV